MNGGHGVALPMHIRIGLRGEQFVGRYLRERKYVLYGSNYATKLGETDIVALEPKSQTLCFIEVKTRKPGGLLPPSAAVDYEKRKRLVNNAAAFIRYFKVSYDKIRFDIAEVTLYDMYHADVNYIENAFQTDAFPVLNG